MIIHIKGGFKAVCENCGRLIEEYADTREQAKEIAKEWERDKEGNYYCSKCAVFKEEQ